VTTPALPTFDIVDASGRRRRVHPHAPADSVAELGRALGSAPGGGLDVDGRRCPPHQRLVNIDALRHGSLVTPPGPVAADAEPSEEAPVEEAPVEFAVLAGPACQPWTPLRVGRHGVGRAPHAAIRLNDARVETHHAHLDVDASGSTKVTQLTGRIPVGAGNSLMLGSSRVEIRTRPATGRTRTGGTAAAIPGDPWRRELRRGATRSTIVVPAEPALPEPAATFDRPAATALIGAFVGVVGALVMAVFVGQAMFALFAGFAAVASLATWLAGVIGAMRRQRRATSLARAHFDTFVTATSDRHAQMLAHDRDVHPDIVDALGELRDGCSLVWSRRPESGQLTAVLGRGSIVGDDDREADRTNDRVADRPAPEVLAVVQQHRRFDDVAIPISLRPTDTVALHGATDIVAPLMRSLIVQLATWVGPADMRLIVVTPEPSTWSWVAWLPHARDGGNAAMVLDSTDPAHLARLHDAAGDGSFVEQGGRVTVVVTDDPALLTVRTGPLRRFMSSVDAITLVLVDRAANVPAVCRRVLAVSDSARACWTGERRDTFDVVDLHVAGIDVQMATNAARRLAPLVDPEDRDTAANLPRRVTLSTLDDVLGEHDADRRADGIALRWLGAGADPSLRAPIGTSADGVVEVDLVADGPHALIAGTTGSGKSELLRTLVVSMASRVSPDHLTFMLVDYKGGSTFDCCVDLPHTVGVVTDLDDGLAERALVSLDAELGRREQAFRAAGVGDLGAYRTQPDLEPIPRLVVVIDEFATLAHDLPEFLTALVAIAQRGRSLGIHLVLATQRPSGVIDDDIRTNTNLRLALRVTDRADACDVVSDEQPARFSRAHPGRAAIRLGPDELIVFQTAHSSGPVVTADRRLRVTTMADTGGPSGAHRSDAAAGTTELAAAVATIRQATTALAIDPPRRPWLDPLPTVLVAHDLAVNLAGDRAHSAEAAEMLADVVGLVDDPARQARLPLRWDRAAGNLMLVGALGTGLSSTVMHLAAAIGRTATAQRCHLYVIDGLGNPALDAIGMMAHCGAVVRVGEHERIDRLLRRLDAEIDRRQIGRGDGDAAEVVLFVDGLSELRRSLEPIERLASLAMLDRVLDAGPAVGVVSCVTTDGSSAGANAPVAERWVFRTDDPSAARAFGRRGAVVDVEHPGRLRIASSGLHAQVVSAACVGTPSPCREPGVGPPDVTVLPIEVDPSTLPHSTVVTTSGRSIRRLVFGLGGDDLEPAALVLADGDHVFIGGASRTGKTCTLERLAVAWAHIGGADSVVHWSNDDAAALRALHDRLAAGAGRSTLLVVDDADRVIDADGLMAGILAGGTPGVTIAAAARVDAVRSAYGHWTRDVTRSRCGLIMTSVGEVDGDLLGVTLPRRAAIPPRPGLAWMIDATGHRLVQVAGRLRP
jgi:DNA segregation ATPase FtsK/SpoIIIE, S-DNA-T family